MLSRHFSEVLDNFGPTISTKKTEVMHQPASGKTKIKPNISINGQSLNMVDKLTYLGSTLLCNMVIDDEINSRLAFGRLITKMFRTGEALLLQPNLRFTKMLYSPPYLQM